MNLKWTYRKIIMRKFLALIVLSALTTVLLPQTSYATGDDFNLIKASEKIVNNMPVLYLEFNQKLNTSINNNNFFQVTAIEKDRTYNLGGGWVIDDNEKNIYFSNILPNKTYDITIRKLTSRSKEQIENQIKVTVKTKHLEPQFGFAAQGSILPKNTNGGLPIMTINVDEVDIEFLHVLPHKLNAFLQRYYLTKISHNYEMRNLHNYAAPVHQGRFVINDKTKNKRITSNIDLQPIKTLKKPGMYIAVMTRPGLYEYSYKTAYFFISDIGLHARKYKNHIDLYTASLQDGKPIKDVDLKLYNYNNLVTSEGKTDAKGYASLKLSVRDNTDSLIIAQKDDEVSFIKINTSALDLSEFPISGVNQNHLNGFIFSNRNLFRPGETLPLSLLLRDFDGKPVAERPIYLTISDPSGSKYKQYTLRSSNSGYYEKDIWIPENAKTGKWTAIAHTSSNLSASIGKFKFNVEEFLPERIKLELTSTEKVYQANESIDIELQADYLYGAPAALNKASAVSIIKPNIHPSKKYKKFFFGNHIQSSQPVRNNVFDGKLDKDGKTKIILKTPAKVEAPMRATLIASVFESGGRAINRSIDRQVWPADTVIGIKPTFDGSYAPVNQDIVFELINIDSNDNLKGADDLEVKLIFEQRDHHWYYDNDNGWEAKYTQLDHERFKTTVNLKQNKVGKVSIPAQRWGRYRVEVRTKDKKILTSYRFRMGWFSDDNNSNRPNKVQLSLDKEKYQAGEIAKLKIKPPHAGNALIMVESNKKLFSKRIYVPATGIETDIKIEPEWDSQNIYISAVIFREASKKEMITPQRAMGIIHLPLERKQRKLAVQIEPIDKALPNQELQLKIKIDGVKNKKVWVKFAAVDVGILNITNYKTPDPFSHFFAKRRYNVDSYDLYNKIIENQKGRLTKQQFGGDADMSGKRKNRLPKAKVKLISLSKQLLQTDESGNAMIKFKAPDFNGKLKLTAIAFTDDSFGSGESETIVASPIVAEISTPKFLSDNDAAMIALDIQNLSGSEQEIEFELITEAPLKVSNYSSLESIADKSKKSYFFEISAGASYGIGKIKLKLSTANKFQLEREWELAIRPAYPSEMRTFMTKIAGDAKFTLKQEWVKGLNPESTIIDIVASNTPPFNLNNIAKGLFGYPYGCLEQTTSKAFANLFIDDKTAKLLNRKPISTAERIDKHERAISRLSGMQLANGAFGLWSSNSPEQPWLSSYVADYLLTAKDKGFEVPELMLNKLLAQLKNRINGRSLSIVRRLYSQDNNHLAFASDSYAAYVLSKVNMVQLSTLRNMYEYKKSHAKSGLPLVHLGVALINLGDKRKGMEAIKDGIKTKRGKRYLGDYGTSLRDSALMLSLIENHAIKLENNLIHTIWQESEAKRYLSTQERVSILKAGFSTINESSPFTVGVIQEMIEERVDAKKFFSMEFTHDDVITGTDLQFISDKDMFVYAAVSGYPTKPPKPKMDNFEVTRNLYSMDGKPLDKRVFASGEMVIAHLQIKTNEYYDNAMVIDLIPAGLEIENLNLSQGDSLNNIQLSGINPAAAMQSYNIKHIEFRDDRYVAALALSPNRVTHLFYILRAVSPGVYIVPPTYIEDMYRPQHNGVGLTQKPITVQNK